MHTLYIVRISSNLVLYTGINVVYSLIRVHNGTFQIDILYNIHEIYSINVIWMLCWSWYLINKFTNKKLIFLVNTKKFR